MNRLVGIFIVFVCLSFESYGQNEKYEQLWNAFEFNRTINDKWTLQVDYSSTFSNTKTNSIIFAKNIQNSLRVWMHYYYGSRWKLSCFGAYFYNKDAPEIGQFQTPEYRLALQGIYYFHKIGYTLSTRMRFEYRYLKNEEGSFYDMERYRQQLKFIKPINSKVLRKGVFYTIVSDEVYFRSIPTNSAFEYFDRNRLTAGVGYLFTDDIQLELSYVNEFLPRGEKSQLYQVASFTLTFNNVFHKVQ